MLAGAEAHADEIRVVVIDSRAESGRIWRLLIGDGSSESPPLESVGAVNMAVDQVLFDSAQAGAPPTVRFYRWSPACLSLGRNQPARGRYDEAGREPGVHVVRRPTGGLAVYHDDELTYSLACRVGELGSPRETYLRVHAAIAAGLAELGAETSLSSGPAPRLPSPADPGGVCFHAPAEGEVLAAAGKLVGSAQRTEARTILQHGSILLAGSQDRAAAPTPVAAAGRVAASRGSIPRTEADSDHADARAPVATLGALLGRVPDDDRLISAIASALVASLGIRLAPASLSADEQSRLEAAAAHYGSANWTWRT